MSGLIVARLLLCAGVGALAFGDSPDALREKVTSSKVFQDKVAASCKDMKEQDKHAECESEATDRLFCALISRSKNAQVSEAEHCTGSFAAVKAEVEKSPEFQQTAENLAGQMGCSGVKKSQNCDAFVQEAAFCLAFADKMGRFAGLTGQKEEAEYCKHIDEKMPQLSLLAKQLRGFKGRFGASLVQVSAHRAPEDDLAKEMTHDLEMNFNKIAPFGKEDTAKELQDHAAKTQDTLVDAVENAEVAEIKRAVFRALTRLRAATIKEFDTIARLETQAIDAYNDAHHYRAENPLTHLHEDEAPVETDKLKSFH